jgi:hypothetical protein
MPVGRIETAVVSIPLIAIACGIGYVVYSTKAENAAQDAAARQLGFSGYVEQQSAAARGAKTPAEWRAKLAEDVAREKALKEERARVQAEVQRQWEADAPKRAAAEEAARKRALAEMEDRLPPETRITLIGQSWSTGGFDTIGLMSFTLKNDNPYDIKDFSISCSFYGNSGTKLGERFHTVYERVKAKTSRSFSSVNIGFIPSQAARGGCQVQSAIRL